MTTTRLATASKLNYALRRELIKIGTNNPISGVMATLPTLTQYGTGSSPTSSPPSSLWTAGSTPSVHFGGSTNGLKVADPWTTVVSAGSNTRASMKVLGGFLQGIGASPRVRFGVGSQSTTGNETTTGGCGLGFNYDGRYFEFELRDLSNSQFRMRINGEWASAAHVSPSSGSGGSNLQWQQYDLGSYASREIEIFFGSAAQLVGFNFETGRNVYALDYSKQPKVMIIGDSITAGSVVGDIRDVWHLVMCDRLGINTAASLGAPGSGYLVGANTGGSTARQRIADVTTFGTMDLIIFALGINDNLQDAAAVQTEVTAYYTAVFAAQPSAFIICMGPWRAPSKNTPTAIADAIKAGFEGATGYSTTRHKFVDTFAGNYQYGSSINQTGTIDGNAYYNITSDGVHPNSSGHISLGGRTAQDVLGALEAMS